MEEDQYAIVIDNGSGAIKAGFAGEESPTTEFSSIIGRTRQKILEKNIAKKDFYVGDEAQRMRGLLNITYPIKHGIVTNWEDMETIWRHLFEEELHVASDDYPVLMIDTPYNPQSYRQKMTQVLFESFNLPAMRVISSGILITYACGRGRGIVLDVGDSQTSVVGLYEGHSLPYGVERVDFGGRDLTNCLASFLMDRGYSFTTTAQRELIREVKEKHCEVSIDYEQEQERTSLTSETFELPDGQVVTIGNEKLKCPEILFQPSLIGLKHPGIHELIYRVLMSYDIDCRRDLACNIMVSGGTTLFRRMKERLEKEMKSLLPHMKFKIICPPDRKYSTWIGGSVIASLSTFQESWIQKKDYDEYGPTIIHSDDIF